MAQIWLSDIRGQAWPLVASEQQTYTMACLCMLRCTLIQGFRHAEYTFATVTVLLHLTASNTEHMHHSMTIMLAPTSAKAQMSIICTNARSKLRANQRNTRFGSFNRDYLTVFAQGKT